MITQKTIHAFTRLQAIHNLNLIKPWRYHLFAIHSIDKSAAVPSHAIEVSNCFFLPTRLVRLVVGHQAPNAGTSMVSLKPTIMLPLDFDLVMFFQCNIWTTLNNLDQSACLLLDVCIFARGSLASSVNPEGIRISVPGTKKSWGDFGWSPRSWPNCRTKDLNKRSSVPGPSKGCQVNPNGWWIDTL